MKPKKKNRYAKEKFLSKRQLEEIEKPSRWPKKKRGPETESYIKRRKKL